MKTIAVIGVPWNAGELVPAAADARALGVRLCVVDRPEALRRVPAGADCDVAAVPAMTPARVAGVVSGPDTVALASVSELTLETTARVRELLGHPGATPAAERAMVDKALCREILAGAGLCRVSFTRARLAELRTTLGRLDLPVVVKPRALAGGNGVRLVADLADLADLEREYDPGTATAFGRDEVLIEEFIPGEEISAEAVVIDGTLVLLTLTDKLNSGPPYFQECGHILPGRRADLWAPAGAYLQRVVRALGMVTSPVHAELKIVGDRLELVEMNARFGGGGIVRLMTEALSIRPFKAYFAALIDGRHPTVRRTGEHWGVGFFTARVGAALSWPSYDFPCPDSVVEIDLDRRREPKLTTFEGIRIRFWRPGHALFASPDYRRVHANVAFMTAQFAG